MDKVIDLFTNATCLAVGAMKVLYKLFEVAAVIAFAMFVFWAVYIAAKIVYIMFYCLSTIIIESLT
jgi:hypothetical protein